MLLSSDLWSLTKAKSLVRELRFLSGSSLLRLPERYFIVFLVKEKDKHFHKNLWSYLVKLWYFWLRFLKQTNAKWSLSNLWPILWFSWNFSKDLFSLPIKGSFCTIRRIWYAKCLSQEALSKERLSWACILVWKSLIYVFQELYKIPKNLTCPDVMVSVTTLITIFKKVS